MRAAVLRRKERGCGSCIVAPESALSSGGSSMGICVGCSSMVVGGRERCCVCCLHRVLVLPG